MGLSLVVGPAHAGKVEQLLDRFVGAIERDPWLIVPNRSDVERVERELVERCGGLLAGTIGTFDTVFEALAHGDGGGRRLLGDAERSLLLRRLSEAGPADGARFAGYADAVGRALAELDGGLLEPDDLDEPLASLTRAYRAELDRLDAWDRGMLRRRAIERLTGELDAWGDNPVLAHGFEDLTGAEWRLLEALSARTDVHVSIPYEPGRAVYASLRRTVEDLSALAGDDVVELPPRAEEFLPPGLAHLERALFTDTPAREPLDGSIRFLEGAGTRGTLELVAEEALALVSDRRPAGGDRGRLPVGRVGQARTRGGLRRARGPGRVRGPRPAPVDAVRPCAARPAAVRVARRRAAGALRAPSLAVLGPAAQGRRLDRRKAPGPGHPQRRPCGRGHHAAP